MSQERKIRRIPIFLDLLLEEAVNQEQAKEIAQHVANGIANKRQAFSFYGYNVKELRLMVKDRVLVIQDFDAKTHSIQHLDTGKQSQNEMN